jgi:hypothetical protein
MPFGSWPLLVTSEGSPVPVAVCQPSVPTVLIAAKSVHTSLIDVAAPKEGSERGLGNSHVPRPCGSMEWNTQQRSHHDSHAAGVAPIYGIHTDITLRN